MAKGHRSKIKRERNEVRDTRPSAKLSYARVSVQKACFVLDAIRGKSVNEALAIVTYNPRYASSLVKKLLESAIANAENNYPEKNYKAENLYVAECFANKGPTMKRIHPRAQGRAYRIEKRMSHITIVLEDNAEGKVTDEWFMQLSHKYEVERFELKEKIKSINEQPGSIAQAEQNKDSFISAVRKFLEMKSLTPALLQEPIERTEVRKIEGVGKNRTQKVTIYYRFVEHIEIPEGSNYKPDTRKGVAVKYLSGGISA